MSTKKKPQGIKTSLTPSELRRLIAVEQRHTEEVLANPMIWLPDDQIITLNPDHGPEYGFDGVVHEGNLGVDLASLSLKDIESVTRRFQGGSGKGKGKGKGGKGGGKPSGPQKMPSAAVVAQVMAKYFVNLPKAGDEGNVVIVEQNALFGDAQKALTYKDGWAYVVEPGHFHLWSEVDPGFVQQIAKLFNLGVEFCKPNTRNQGLGITAHKRMKLVAGPFEYTKVATVQGIPDLRPGLCCVYLDTWSGQIFKVVVNHLKSMRGGPKLTSPVRYQQCVELVKAHGPATEGIKPAVKNQQVRNTWRNQVYGRGFLDHGTLMAEIPMCKLADSETSRPMEERIKRGLTIMGGDWNTFLDNTTDVQPLINAGYLLVNPGDKTPTHSMGSRLDGLFAEKENNPECKVDVVDGPDEVLEG